MSGYWGNPGDKGHGPLFQNVVFESNQTKHTKDDAYKSGGAIYAYRSTPFFRDVTFKYNFAARGGGAVWIENADTNKTVTFERTKFIGNYLDPPSELDLKGGAVYLGNIGKIIFENSTFDSNYIKINGNCCTNDGGAIYAQSFYDSLIIENTKFRHNKVYKPDGNNGGKAEAGAIYINDGKGHAVFTNSVFLGNSAEAGYRNWDGGGSDQQANGGAVRISMQYWSDGNTSTYPYKSIFINNTFVDNKAIGSGTNSGYGGALNYSGNASTVLVNNIFWGNEGNNFGSDTTRNEIANLFNYSNSQIIAGHNNFKYSATESRANGYGSDNISLDPQFLLDGSADQYKLSDASFLIGAGTKTYDAYTAPAKDILGNARPTGSSSDQPDMGAYENSLAKTTYPAKVKSLTATAANQSVILAWTANSESNIAKYAVYQSKTSPFTPAKTDSIGETTTASFTSTGLQNGIAYHFKVKAINSSNQSGEYSDQASATPGYEGAGGWYVAIADKAAVAIWQ